MTAIPYDLEAHGLKARRIATNGIELNVFEAGTGPLVILLHGFPECWASWGPQITYLLDKGYRVAVPEMRGYGESDAPKAVESFDTVELAADIAGLIDGYGLEKAVVIGHDWGCIVAWHVAWLHPEKVVGVGGLSVPWFGRGKRPTNETLTHNFGDKYFYINDFQRPVLNDQLNADQRETLTKVLLGNMNILGQGEDDAAFLDRLKLIEPRADFIPEDFMDYLVSRYAFTGFEGPLNWYRNFARTFERTEGMESCIYPPAMYLTGKHEWTHKFIRNTGFDMSRLFNDLRINDVVEAGHWLGQEQPDWTNQKITEFLDSLDY